VGVQAFDSPAGSAHATARAVSAIAVGNGGIPLSGIAAVGGGQLIGVDGGFGAAHPRVPLQPAHSQHV